MRKQPDWKDLTIAAEAANQALLALTPAMQAAGVAIARLLETYQAQLAEGLKRSRQS